MAPETVNKSGNFTRSTQEGNVYETRVLCWSGSTQGCLLDRLEEGLITGVIISAERSAKVYIPGHGYFLTADKDREG